MQVCQLGDCTGQNRCIDPQCSQAEPCAENSKCSNTQCVHQPCAVDSECSGYCVNGVCAAGLGICNQQAEYP